MPTDLNDLEQALQTYFDGLYEGDTAKLGRVFHDVAHLFSVADGRLGDMSRGSGSRWCATGHRHRSGSAAARLGGADRPLQPDYGFREGQCQIPPRYFTDYLAFVKLAEGWRIVSKTFHTETH